MRLSRVVVAIFAVTSSAQAQTSPVNLHIVVGPTFGSLFGTSVVGIGDVDYDGVDDFGVGAKASTSGASDPGSVHVYSGKSGTRIYTIQGTDSQGLFGSTLARVSDLDADGVDDLLIGAPGVATGGVQNSGAAYVYSGADGHLILTLDEGPAGTNGGSLGASVADAGDVNGDGKADLLVGAPSANYIGLGGGAAFVYSGATGARLLRIDGSTSNAGLGSSVSNARDVNGDGVPDVLVGAPGAYVTPTFNPGAVFAFSGSNGSELFRADGSQIVSGFGATIAQVGDLDGDGFPDFAVGAPSEAGAKGAIHYCSGATGLEIRSLLGTVGGDVLGAAIADVGDVNGDGIEDLAAGLPFASPGSVFGAGVVRIYSTSNDSLIAEIRGPDQQAELGASVAGADVNGDGRSDVIAGAPMGQPRCFTSTGVAGVWSFADSLPSRALILPTPARLNLGSGRSVFEVLLEPVGASFQLPDVIPGTIVIRPTVPSYDEIHANTPSIRVSADEDGNGIQELSIPFAKADARCFFGLPPASEASLTVSLEATLTSGARTRASLLVTVISPPTGRITIAPNPIRASSMVSFRTVIPGYARVRLYDVRGRVAGVPLEKTWLAAGFHDVPLVPTSHTGFRLPSGVYFLELETAEGTDRERAIIVR